MRRIGLFALGIGVLISVGLLSVAQGFADDNDGATKCSLKTLKGRYLFAGSGTLFPPAFGVTEVSVDSAAGYHIFDGNGAGQPRDIHYHGWKGPGTFPQRPDL